MSPHTAPDAPTLTLGVAESRPVNMLVELATTPEIK